MPIDDVVGMLLWQAVAHDFEGPAAIAGDGDAQASADGDALFVLDLGHEPGGVGVLGVDDDAEPERGGFGRCADFGEGAAGIG